MEKALAAAGGLVVSLCVFARQPVPYSTTKVEGTDNVYIFRAGNHQAMFVVTKAGVIATDPIGYGRPQMVNTYVEEIKKVSDQPIKYLIYSHHHSITSPAASRSRTRGRSSSRIGARRNASSACRIRRRRCRTRPSRSSAR